VVQKKRLCVFSREIQSDIPYTDSSILWILNMKLRSFTTVRNGALESEAVLHRATMRSFKFEGAL
jgi:hypothetical protein